MAATREVTRNLIEWRNGNEAAIEKILPVIYDELRRSARRNLRRESADTSIQTIELINEAYLKLVDQRESDWQNRAHFFAVAARVMRRILVDFARSSGYQKRGGDWRRVTLADEIHDGVAADNDIVAIDEAVDALAEFDSRKARVVELRFFGGLNHEEIAEALQISTDTVTRDWKAAKAWLARELKR